MKARKNKQKEKMKMKKVTVSLKSLYDMLGSNLQHGEILKTVDGEWEYYELQTDDGTVCMDGEECEIIQENNDYIVLKSVEDDPTFTLTRKEMNIAVFSMNKNENNNMMVNLFHCTNDLYKENILENGLLLSNARSEAYGEKPIFLSLTPQHIFGNTCFSVMVPNEWIRQTVNIWEFVYDRDIPPQNISFYSYKEDE